MKTIYFIEIQETPEQEFHITQIPYILKEIHPRSGWLQVVSPSGVESLLNPKSLNQFQVDRVHGLISRMWCEEHRVDTFLQQIPLALEKAIQSELNRLRQQYQKLLVKLEKIKQLDGYVPLDHPIEELDLSVSVYNSLKRGGIQTEQELYTYSLCDLMGFRNIKRGNLQSLIETLVPTWRGSILSLSKEEEALPLGTLIPRLKNRLDV